MNRPDPPPENTPRRGQRTDTRVVLAIGGMVLFTPPLMGLMDRETTLLGVPLLLVYVFTAWIAGIGLTAWAARRDSGTH
ncbi:MAG: hypothetical protein AAGD34_13560 [Pseudomonadota bacterium]